jgi:excisionase family DNA binding protein
MAQNRTYTISEAAALTGLHRNTIRQRIRLNQLEATVQQGKFGEEYRIPHTALVKAGLLSDTGPLGETGPSETVFTADVVEPESEAPPAPEPEPEPNGETQTALSRTTVQALGELYQRHEQAMFRLGYLQGELERMKALAESAESLQQERVTRDEELRTLKQALEEKERKAAEAETLRQELDSTQERLREMEQLRKELEGLKDLATQLSKRPWWRFWS